MKLRPYVDTVGKLTIGIGRNLTDVGISENEALYLLASDIQRAMRGLADRYSDWFPALDSARQAVLVNMGVNLGLSRLAGFTKMLDAVARGDFAQASTEMLQSKWAMQVGNRATELAAQMNTGGWA